MSKITMFLAMIFVAFVAQAVEMGVPIQLKLKNPSGVYPDDNSAQFTVQILSPSNGCVLREEDFANQIVVSGTISLALGSGNRAGYDPSISLAAVYDNSTVKNNLSCVDANNNLISSGQSYNPAATDVRILRVRATITGIPIVADFTQRAAPYAIHADSVGGKVASDLIVQNGATSLNQTNLESLLLDATRFNKLQNLAVNGVADSATAATTAGTATNFSGNLAGDITGAQSATVVAAIRGVGVAATAPVSGQVLGYNGSQYVPMTFVASAPVASVNGKTGAVLLTIADIPGALTSASALAGDVTGNPSATVVTSVGGKTASDVASAVNTVNAATALAVANSLALRDGSGNLIAAGLTAAGASLQNIYLYESTNANRVQVRAPNSFANYTLVLPTSDGNSGEVLQTDGNGNLSWNGGVAVTSAAIASALGYTPADASVVAGALQQTTFDAYVASASCAMGQSMYWNSVSSEFLCQGIAVSGDISGNASSVTVTKLRGVGVSFSAIANNHILQYNGTNIVNRAVPTCSAGEYLTFNGSVWSCVTDLGSGSLTSLSVTAPISSTGGSTPTLSIAQANGSTSGFLASSDWTTFNNKMAATSAAVISALGYTPANSASLTIGTSAGTIAAGDDSRITGALQQTTFNTYVASANCTATQSMYWNSVSSTFLCQNIITGGVSAVAVTAPLQSTGGVTPTLSMPQATASVSGYLTAADWTTFNNKITSSSASVAQVLGYTPANSATVSLKANNLSDLTNIATARSNLGLGAFATASSLDLGSASATGTLALARLPAFTGDVTSTAGSNSLTVTKLQGVAVNNSVPEADQALVYDGAQWIATTGFPKSSRVTSNISINGTTYTNAMSFPVASGKTYKFKFNILYATSGTTRGLRLRINHPGATVYSALYSVPASTSAGTGFIAAGTADASGDTFTSSTATPAGTQYAQAEGVIVASANGTVQLAAAQSSTGTLTVYAGSLVEFREIQ